MPNCCNQGVWLPVPWNRRSLASVRAMSDDAVIVEGLEKSYGSVRALCSIDFAARTGSVLALLGPNGAGKTTAVRILATLLQPDGGSARVAGLDVVRDAAALRAKIGLAGQYAAVDENLTGFENLEMVGRLYHLDRNDARTRAHELLERFELTEAAKRPAKTYSGGMRRRLDLAAALVFRPPVLFLDEPTTGLDPRSRLGLWETIEAPRRGRHDRAAHHAVPRGGRPSRGSDRRDRPRQRDRRGDLRRAQDPDRRRAPGRAPRRPGRRRGSRDGALHDVRRPAVDRRPHRQRGRPQPQGRDRRGGAQAGRRRRGDRRHLHLPADARRRLHLPHRHGAEADGAGEDEARAGGGKR